MNRAELEALASTDLSTVSREGLEALAREFLELLADVDAADLTPTYGYGRRGEGPRLNRLGDAPAPGSRWNTPRELVEAATARAQLLIRRSVRETP